jgi:1,4-alpha-glucan branching enzyme
MLSGCATLTFVKPRLAPPQQMADGVLFQFYAPYARLVQLAGSWEENNWLRGNAQNAGVRIGEMQGPDRNGIWRIIVPLRTGRYQYKFVIDGTTWKEDPNNPERVDDGFGGFNSLLVLK